MQPDVDCMNKGSLMASRHPLQYVHVSLHNLALASSGISLLAPFAELRCLCGLVCVLCCQCPCLGACHISALSVLNFLPNTVAARLFDTEASVRI